MKIAVISSTVFAVPVRGYAGLEHLAWQQARGLATRGHRVLLMAPEGSECPGCEVVASGPPGGWDERRAYAHYHPRLKEVDVICDHSWHKWSYLGKAEGWLRAPALGWLHAPVNTMFNSPPPVPKPCLVAISEDQARSCLTHLHVPARVCHNAVDSEFYKPLNVKRTDRYLFLARFSTIKGPDIAIEVCKEAGVGLDLVGDTSITNEPELLDRCKNLADGRQIRLVGPASRTDCVWWFSRARALLHPNLRFQEPFGLAPVEAQLCECPVIAFDNGACRETVRHGETGFLVESKEQMTDIVRKNQVLGLEPAVCRTWASRFSIERMVSRVEELCTEALNTGGW